MMDEEKLIEAVRRINCLWDVAHKSYRDSRSRENAWKRVASEVGEGVTSEDCDKKWKNLRDHFVRELRKKKKSHSGDKGPPYNSTWPYFDILLFLADTVRHKATFSNFGGVCPGTSEFTFDSTDIMVEHPAIDLDDSVVHVDPGLPQCTSPPLLDALSTSSSQAASQPTSPRALRQTSKRRRPQEDDTDYVIAQGIRESAERRYLRSREVKDKEAVEEKNPEIHYRRGIAEKEAVEEKNPEIYYRRGIAEKEAVEEKNPEIHYRRGIAEKEEAETLYSMSPRQRAVARFRIQQVLLEVQFPEETAQPHHP